MGNPDQARELLHHCKIFFLPLDFFFGFYYKETKLVSMSPLELFGNKIPFLQVVGHRWSIALLRPLARFYAWRKTCTHHRLPSSSLLQNAVNAVIQSIGSHFQSRRREFSREALRSESMTLFPNSGNASVDVLDCRTALLQCY